MATTSASIFRCKLQMPYICKLQPHIIRFSHFLVISNSIHKAKNHQILRNHNLQPPGIGLRLLNTDRDNNLVVCCSIGSGPSDPGSWKLWVVGIVMSIILPFWRSKWGPLLKLKDEVETIIDKAEEVTDIVEKVAGQVEEVADDIGNHMPEGRLKNALQFVEDMAQNTADGARLAGDLIDKVEEVEGKVESWMGQDSIDEEAKIAKEEEEDAATKDQA
ncbi:hypothetical protein ES319_A02G083400v1 [Gossypium barbadense]|uniref:Uncharacterized protein n=2 Tax=Gossypium TaxID=3633 RepID=A0A5J5WN33_GOSBA|nr:hypothetical protein ES319_A02G083400v1 [Gossypium barbadense]TYH27743.1 hypothetical protein ES288_A02G092400v1 [Gossypium darwinii]